ncbi:MAG TPA: hypothetical protein VLE72_03010 [Candidatus Saccharimonadales bacterium]|nr:hypothetical protein [Candidatus Saccharimonadales bacterium]
MKWQDLIFVAGITILSLSLIPTIRGRQKPALITSLVTIVILIIFVVTDVSLNLPLSAAVTALSVVAWVILAYQKSRQAKRR